jgi:hypothetical protein
MIGAESSRVSRAVAAMEDNPLAELSALVEMALGHPIEPETLATLRAIQVELWNARSDLVTRLHDGEITPDQYLERLHDAIRGAMSRSLSLLGEERFQRIFGESGRNPEGLVNRNIFMEQTIADA